MPKEILNITEFHAGLNNASYPTDVDNLSSTKAQNIDFDTYGQIRLCGGTVVHAADTNSPSVEILPGYGLHQFSHDRVNGHIGAHLSESDFKSNDDWTVTDQWTDSSVGKLADYSPTPSEAWRTSQSHSSFLQESTSGSGTGMYVSAVTDSSGNPTFTITNGGTGFATGDTVVFGDPSDDGELFQGNATVTISSLALRLRYVTNAMGGTVTQTAANRAYAGVDGAQYVLEYTIVVNIVPNGDFALNMTTFGAASQAMPYTPTGSVLSSEPQKFRVIFTAHANADSQDFVIAATETTTSTGDFRIIDISLKLYDNAETGEDYLVLADNESADPAIYMYAKNADTWSPQQLITIGTATGQTFAPTFFYDNGALRISDSNFNSSNTNKWYGYIKRILWKSLSTAWQINYDEWIIADQGISAPAVGSVYWDDIGNNTEKNLISASRGNYVAILMQEDGAGANIIDFYKKKWNVGVSYTYDEGKRKQHSAITVVTTEKDGSAIKEIDMTGEDKNPEMRWGLAYHAKGAMFNNKRITGHTIWIREAGDSNESADSTWYLIQENDWIEGICKNYVSGLEDTMETYVELDTGGNSMYFIENDTDSTSETMASIPQITFNDFTGYKSSETITAQYKTATVLNRSTYIANVRQAGITYGDRMIKSPVNMNDVFPSESRFVDIISSDGDNIIKLESFADRILQFKKNKLLIWMVTQDMEQLESTYMHKGILHPASACKTDYGIAWVNRFGCYLFDGENIHDLLEKEGVVVISPTEWDKFLRADKSTTGNELTPMIQYLPKDRKLLVFDDITDTSTAEPRMYIYHLTHQSWTTATHGVSDNSLGGAVSLETLHTLTAAEADDTNPAAFKAETKFAPIFRGTEKLGYDSGGTSEILTGDIITGADSTAYGTVGDLSINSGSFAGGDAAGHLYFYNQSGTFTNNEQLNRTGSATTTNIATADGTNSDICTVKLEESDATQIAISTLESLILGSKNFVQTDSSTYVTLNVNLDNGEVLAKVGHNDMDEGGTLKFTYDYKSLTGNRDINKIKTNSVVDVDGNCVWAHSTGTIVKWDDSPKQTKNVFYKTKFLDFGNPAQGKKIYKVYVTHRYAGTVSLGLYGEIVSQVATSGQTGIGEVTNDFFFGYLVQDDTHAGSYITQAFSPPSADLSGNALTLGSATALRLYIQSYMSWGGSEAGASLDGTAHASFSINDVSIVYRKKTIK